jgi:hypothetical protein
MALSGILPADTAGDKFVGPVGTDGVLGKAFRGTNPDANSMDMNVVLYDATGAALLTTTHPGVVKQVRGSKTPTQVGVGATAVQLAPAAAGRLSVTIANAGSQTIYLGSSGGVTVANGMPLVAGGILVDDTSTDAWHGICASAGGDARVIVVA